MSGSAAPLPSLAGPLIGRTDEIAALHALLTASGTRLLTLTGPGGVGKTRLALHVAAELRDVFVDGVWFASLAALHNTALVPAAIARALGYDAGAAPLDVLSRALRDQHVLLLLGNFEQVVDAARLSRSC